MNQFGLTVRALLAHQEGLAKGMAFLMAALIICIFIAVTELTLIISIQFLRRHVSKTSGQQRRGRWFRFSVWIWLAIPFPLVLDAIRIRIGVAKDEILTQQREVFLSQSRQERFLNAAVRAYASGDKRRVSQLVTSVEQDFPGAAELQRKAKHLEYLANPMPLVVPQEVPEDKQTVWASTLRCCQERVGWGTPLRDRVLIEYPGDCFLQIDGQFFDRGLYAHAPATYQFELRKGWKRFRSGYGLQDGHDGSVVFVVLGDGKELFRSPLVRDHVLRPLDLDASDVDLLELAVEDAGDGNTHDWSVWIEPRLER